MALNLLRIDHIGITARDVDTSVAFYRDVLGLSPVEETPPHTATLRSGQVELAISPWNEGEREPGDNPRGDHFALLADPSQFEELKVTLLRRGIQHMVVGTRIYLKDPDGYTIELKFGGA